MDKSRISLLLKALRGGRSQIEMSLFLGLDRRIYHKWEAGYKEIKAQEFDLICGRLGIDFREILKKSLNLLEVGKFKSDTIHLIEISWKCDEREFLRASGFSKSKWWRLKNEDQYLNLVDLFQIINHRTGKLSLIFEKLGLSDLTPGKGRDVEFENKKKLLRYFQEIEYFSLFAASLYLKEVKESKGKNKKIQLISTKLNLEKRELEKLVDSLVEEGLLIEGSDGNYDFVAFENHIDEYHRDLGAVLFENISKRAINLLKNQSGEKKCSFAYRVAPVSQGAYRKLQELQKKFSSDVYQIICDDEDDCHHIYSLGLSGNIDNF